MRRADRIDDYLDARFAAGDFSRATIDACNEAIDAGLVPPAIVLAMACERQRGGPCALCGSPIRRGENGKIVAAAVPYQQGDAYPATTVRRYCARCFVAAQGRAEA